jgi:hypothetical protein
MKPATTKPRRRARRKTKADTKNGLTKIYSPLPVFKNRRLQP